MFAVNKGRLVCATEVAMISYVLVVATRELGQKGVRRNSSGRAHSGQAETHEGQHLRRSLLVLESEPE